MIIKSAYFTAVLATALALALVPAAAVAQTEPQTRIALMPFLLGQLESPNALLVKPLSTPVANMAVDNRGLPEEADRVINRLLTAALKQRYAARLVPWEEVVTAYGSIGQDPLNDTPRKRAIQLGQAVQADIVVVGTIWRFREKGAVEGVPDSPASVGFALYLVDVETGARLERGFFDGTQKALTEDVLGGAKQLGMGLRWLSAEELARFGIKTVLRKLSAGMDR